MTATRTGPGRRWAALGVVAAVQLALVAAAVGPRLSARLTGEEYLLRVASADPVHPFRGSYVALTYPDLGLDSSLGERGTVFLPLTRDGQVWRGGPALGDPPAEGPFLRCHDGGDRLECGIDSYFLPQADARRMQDALTADRARARVRVDGDGNAALVELVLPS